MHSRLSPGKAGISHKAAIIYRFQTLSVTAQKDNLKDHWKNSFLL